MKTNTIITIILGIAFVGICIVAGTQGKDRLQLEYDLCYSLKMNRVLLEGYDPVYEHLNISKSPIEEAHTELEKVEDRNWLECEE